MVEEAELQHTLSLNKQEPAQVCPKGDWKKKDGGRGTATSSKQRK